MQPQIHLNWIAIIVAVVASFFFGWFWHGPLFGKKWAKLMKMKMSKKPSTKFMMRSMGLTILGTFLTTYVLAHSVEVWRPSTWGAGTDGPFYIYGFCSGFFVWLGYFVAMQLHNVAWEGRGWGVFTLNSAFHLLNLQIIGMILAYWR